VKIREDEIQQNTNLPQFTGLKRNLKRAFLFTIANNFPNEYIFSLPLPEAAAV
jgi:hypothetical protein